jgi:hypothetical protein
VRWPLATVSGAVPFRRRAKPALSATVRLLPERTATPVGREGGVRSLQEAEVILPVAAVRSLWRPEYLERLARGYWRYLSRISLHVLRVVYTADSRTVVVLFRPFALLRFHAPDYEISGDGGTVTWRIDRGLLVQRSQRGRGHLSISVRRRGTEAGVQRLLVAVEVRNFYPWLRGSGWFSRFGTLLYTQTQMRIHKRVTRGFLRDLARLDLPPSRVGSLPGEMEGDPAYKPMAS